MAVAAGRALRAMTAVVQLTLAVLVMFWICFYLNGFSFHPTPTSPGANDTGRLFNWHPILMVLAFPLLMAEAVMVYRSPYLQHLGRPQQKTVHASLHAAALICAALGVLAAWKSHTLKLPVPTGNLYSAHSWLGILTLSLVAVQALVGVYVYLYPKLAPSRRAVAYRFHYFAGAATFIMALATMCVGLQEKASFIQVFGKADVFSPVIRLPAVIGLFIALTGILVFSHHLLVPKEEEAPNVDYERVV